MKTITTHLFSFNELETEAQDKVIEILASYRDVEQQTNEAMESLKAIAEAMGTRLTDWSLGPDPHRAKAKVANSFDEGHRLTADFVRCLIENGYSRPKRFADMEFPGICGFTGVCYDETAAESILEALIQGETMDQAFSQAAQALSRELEAELDYQQSRESILEYLDTSEEIYSADGEEA